MSETKIDCPYCGGADYTSFGSMHHETCPHYWHPRHEETVVLRLNAYQAVNLLRALTLMWDGELHPPNSGDWCGEIPQQLEAKMRAAGGDFVAMETNDAKLPLTPPDSENKPEPQPTDPTEREER